MADAAVVGDVCAAIRHGSFVLDAIDQCIRQSVESCVADAGGISATDVLTSIGVLLEQAWRRRYKLAISLLCPRSSKMMEDLRSWSRTSSTTKSLRDMAMIGGYVSCGLALRSLEDCS